MLSVNLVRKIWTQPEKVFVGHYAKQPGARFCLTLMSVSLSVCPACVRTARKTSTGRPNDSKCCRRDVIIDKRCSTIWNVFLSTPDCFLRHTWKIVTLSFNSIYFSSMCVRLLKVFGSAERLQITVMSERGFTSQCLHFVLLRSGVLKDGGSSHPGPDAHGHDAVRPAVGTTPEGTSERRHRLNRSCRRRVAAETNLFPLRLSSPSSATTWRAPVQPSGWPRAMAPPLGFTFSSGIPSFSTQYSAWAAGKRHSHLEQENPTVSLLPDPDPQTKPENPLWIQSNWH